MYIEFKMNAATETTPDFLDFLLSDDDAVGVTLVPATEPIPAPAFKFICATCSTADFVRHSMTLQGGQRKFGRGSPDSHFGFCGHCDGGRHERRLIACPA